MPGGRQRKPCALCGGSRDCDTPANELRRKVEGERIAVCPSCLEKLKATREERMRAHQQPEFRVREDSVLGQRFAEIEDDFSDAPEGFACL